VAGTPRRSLRALGQALESRQNRTGSETVASSVRRVSARPRSHAPGKMNKLEARYARNLDLRRLAGEVASWRFEAVKLRLAGRTWYTPDFLVVLSAGACELHEVKGGHWEDDARVKFKVAAEQWPEWTFVAVSEHGVSNRQFAETERLNP